MCATNINNQQPDANGVAFTAPYEDAIFPALKRYRGQDGDSNSRRSLSDEAICCLQLTKDNAGLDSGHPKNMLTGGISDAVKMHPMPIQLSTDIARSSAPRTPEYAKTVAHTGLSARMIWASEGGTLA